MKQLTLVATLVAGLALPLGLQAQEASGDLRGELRTLVTEGAQDADADRALIEGFLQQDQVATAAAQGSIDLERVRSAVPAMSDEDAHRVADRVQDVQDQLAGGDTFVISTATIIIALLIVILIVVA